MQLRFAVDFNDNNNNNNDGDVDESKQTGLKRARNKHRERTLCVVVECGDVSATSDTSRLVERRRYNHALQRARVCWYSVRVLASIVCGSVSEYMANVMCIIFKLEFS